MPGATPAHTVRFTQATAKMVKPGPSVVVRSQARLLVKPSLTPKPAPARPARRLASQAARPGLLGWMSTHKVIAVAIGLLLAGATVAVGLAIINTPVTVTPAARAGAPPVVFADGDDVTGLLDYDFITDPTIGTGGISASFTVKGIPGATSVTAAKALKVTNTDDANNDGFSVTFTPATTVAGVTTLQMTFLDDAVLRTIDLLSATEQGPYTLSDNEVWDINIVIVLPASSTITGSSVVSLSATQVLVA